jgi:hypothetical protein
LNTLLVRVSDSIVSYVLGWIALQELGTPSLTKIDVGEKMI